MKYFVFLAFFMKVASAGGQTPFSSESVIKYDIANHSTDKRIPFDRAFTLVVEKISTKSIDAVQLFKVRIRNNYRSLAPTNFISCNGQKTSMGMKDLDLTINRASDTLQIFFPPLKPNCDFDVIIYFFLSPSEREKLLDINAKVKNGSMTDDDFIDFRNGLTDKLVDRSLFPINDLTEYRLFYEKDLKVLYDDISDMANYRSGGVLTANEVKAIDIATSAVTFDYKDGTKLYQAYQKSLWTDIEKGLVDINSVFQPKENIATTMEFGHIRLRNLQSNLIFFDSIYQRLNRVISKGNNSTTIGVIPVYHTDLRLKVEELRRNIIYNITRLKGYMGKVNAAIDHNDDIRQGKYLSGNTFAPDLKTASGNIIFLDAGISVIGAQGVNRKTEAITKLYWGVSIYFRPIDKNTRRTKFYSRFDEEINAGCKPVIERNEDGSVKKATEVYGPDYQVISRYDWRQHISLNIGFTMGGMVNKDFDNLYNGSSLLLGVSYRFCRAFKFSVGTAFLRRTTKNPLVSGARFAPGIYAGVSVDIDLVQGLKEVTSILFK